MSLWLWLVFPAVTMSLGWGLRGYIGGGPLGAMIPGAMVALALALLLNRDEDDAALLAAFGAVGVGFGGQETYGQTVGYSIAANTMWFGLAGLGLKGAVWGLLGGVTLGVALEHDRYTRRHLWTGLALMIFGTWLGWITINRPKLIYFSNRYELPREELWAGLLLGALLWIAWTWPVSRTPARFAITGFVGGGFGFWFGGLLQSLGRQFAPLLMKDYWKLMEFTFGACFGAAWGLCAYRMRRQSNPTPMAPQSAPNLFLALLCIAAAAVAISEKMPGRFDYTLLGAVLLAVAWESRALAWQIGITMTTCAFLIDLGENRKLFTVPVYWLCVVAIVAATAWWISKRRGVVQPLLLLTALSVGDSLMKSFGPNSGGGRMQFGVQGTFVLMAIAVAWLGGRLGQRLDKRVAFGD
ncbi:MAG: hypothetical protein JNK87_39420 [Bryobacterales bacterium]|nr:hypothetical protein [Bryobacterales bacterium]